MHAASGVDATRPQRDFKKHVNACVGWSTKRRKANDKERAEFKHSRRGDAYFIDVMYKPIGAAAGETKAPGKADKKKRAAGENANPQAKKAKKAKTPKA